MRVRGDRGTRFSCSGSCMLRSSLAVLVLLLGECTQAVLVGTGEVFVEAVKEFGLKGGRVLLEFDTSGPISVANASWSPKEQNAGFTKGSLIMQAAPPESGGERHMALFDAAMRSGLAPAVGMDVNVVWQNVIIYNLCSRLLPFKPPEIFQLGQDNLHLLPRGRQLQNYERVNSTIYHPYQGLLSFTNWLVMDTTPFKAIRDRWADFVLQLAPKTDAQVSAMDEFSMTLSRKMAGGLDTNVTFRTTNNPNDPWGLSLPEFGGVHMPHRICASDGTATGPLVKPENVLEANFTFAPTWFISGSEQLSKLDNVSEWGKNPPWVSGKLPPALVVFVNDASFALSLGRATNSTLLRRDTYLRGPLSPFRPTIDMANEKDLIKMDSQADLFVENLAFKGLKSEAIGDGWASDHNTTLHLAGIDRQDSSTMEVAHVTLHIAKQDFLALLSAAHRGEQWQSGATSTAFLMSAIDVFQPTEFSRSSLTLSEYSGWGVKGIDVQFVPSSPLRDSDLLVDQEVPSSSSDNAVALGVGIGVGVGGGLLLIGAVTALAVMFERCKRRTTPPNPSGPYSRKEISIVVTSNVGADGSADSKLEESSPSSECLSTNISQPAQGQDNRSTPQGFPALGLSLNGIELSESDSSVQFKKHQEDQISKDPNMLVRREVEDILKVGDDKSLVLGCALGKGAGGTVYKGTWKGLDVAVKTVLFTEHTESSSLPQKERAILEAAVSASTSHPNIVSTYHYDIKPIRAHHEGLQIDAMAEMNDWKLFLVQEYCHCTLSFAVACGLLHKGGQPLMPRVLNLLLEVADGTRYLHSRQIIHGDLKPDNILLKVDQSTKLGLTAKITDFGLSANLGPHATHASNFTAGTPYYVAPEVATSGRTSKASDTYSFGVIMAEIYSRTPPWVKVDGVYSVNPSFPDLPSGTPQPYSDLALRCLEADLSKRPQFSYIVSSLQGMLENLDKYS